MIKTMNIKKLFSKTTKTEWILFVALIIMAISVLFFKNATDLHQIFMRYKNGTTINMNQGSFKLNDDWYIVDENKERILISSNLRGSYKHYALWATIDKKPNKSYLNNINQVIYIKSQKYRDYNISYVAGREHPEFIIINLTDKNKNHLATADYNKFFDDTVYLRLFDDIIDYNKNNKPNQ